MDEGANVKYTGRCRDRLREAASNLRGAECSAGGGAPAQAAVAGQQEGCGHAACEPLREDAARRRDHPARLQRRLL